ncbi:hypothetical protein A0H76_2338 [Hepatospora eriocheir]|uniref:Uncharacterized protein n=1 Tax=Hepatospora eriocheir TaxID=1081669 RepID=A0A1X0QK48_9MICR|nr:hypothetical protein A0H76_2338 [Hepatospora eriocheir]
MFEYNLTILNEKDKIIYKDSYIKDDCDPLPFILTYSLIENEKIDKKDYKTYKYQLNSGHKILLVTKNKSNNENIKFIDKISNSLIKFLFNPKMNDNEYLIEFSY